MSPNELIRITSLVFVIGLILILLWQLHTGHINTRGLLLDKKSKTFSPGRLQLMVATLLGSLTYLTNGMQSAETSPPEILIWAMLGSQSAYLVGKTLSTSGVNFMGPGGSRSGS